jgi:hypothetical protein
MINDGLTFGSYQYGRLISFVYHLLVYYVVYPFGADPSVRLRHLVNGPDRN